MSNIANYGAIRGTEILNNEPSTESTNAVEEMVGGINGQEIKDIKLDGMGQDAFLKLLVAQLKHQDPMSPLEDQEFMGQMAQFSTLEQISTLNNNFTTFMNQQQSSDKNSAIAMLGKKVEAVDPDTGEVVTGIVREINLGGDEVKINVAGTMLGYNDIIKLVNEE